jgi:hypothetical protein
MEHTVSVNCPECRVGQQVEQRAIVAACSHCQQSIRCVECAQCGHRFAALEQKKLQCPRCLNAIRTWKGSEVPFAALAEQRGADVAPGDVRTAATTPPARRGRPRRRSVFGWILAVVVVAAVAVAAVLVIAHKTTGSKAVPCQLVMARSTLTFTTSRDAQGNYRVVATGTTVNQSSRPLVDVVVTWIVSYANGSTGKTTATLLPNQGTIAKGATSRWSGSPSTSDGPVKPIGVTVLHTYTTADHPSCLT